jgi:putative transposase
MKPSRFTEAQIIGMLRGAGGGGEDSRCLPQVRISSATFYKWKVKYGGLEVSDAKRLKALEKCQAEEPVGRGHARQRRAQGRHLKRIVTPAGKREAVAHPRTSFEVSERRACAVLGVDRTSVRYRSGRPDDAGMRLRLRELAASAAGSVIAVCTS